MIDDLQFLNNILGGITKSGNEVDVDLINSTLKKYNSDNDKTSNISSNTIKELAENIIQNDKFNFDAELNRVNLARWYEIHEEDFKDTKKERLEPETLIHHILLENKFKKWLNEWDYEVEIGEEMDGDDNTEFIPDIYAKRNTLHGIFEIVICFVCSNPPSSDRVLGLFESFETCAKEESEFGNRDIFIVVTPHKFGSRINKAISLQNKQEKYTVFGLEGNDLAVLNSINDSEKRLLELKEHVEKAQLKAINNSK